MGPPSDSEVLFRIPLLLLIAIALCVGAFVVFVWWYRSRRKTASLLPAGDHSWLPALLEALPYGAIFADMAGKPAFANQQASAWLGQGDLSSGLPGSLRLLVERASVSGQHQGPEAQVLPGQRE